MPYVPPLRAVEAARPGIRSTPERIARATGYVIGIAFCITAAVLSLLFAVVLIVVAVQALAR